MRRKLRNTACLFMTALAALAAVASNGPCAPPQPGDDVLEEWRGEAAANAPFGMVGSASLAGSFEIYGEGGQATVSAPFSIVTAPSFPDDLHVIALSGTTIDGVGSGTLLLEGDGISVTAGSLAGSTASVKSGTDLVVGLKTSEGGADTPAGEPLSGDDVPAEWQRVGSTAFFLDTMGTVENLTLDGFVRGLLVTDGEPVEVTAPLVVQGGTLHWDAATGVGLAEGAAVATTWTAAAITGAFDSGSVELEGRAPVSAPILVATDASTTTATLGGLELDDARVTQVATADGYAIDADVEIYVTESELEVPQGGRAYVRALFRERSYAGDGALAEVETSGELGGALSVLVDRHPLIIQQALDAALSTGWGAPIAVLAVVAASPAIILLDVVSSVSCALTDCPANHPYPAWMDAGGVGDFYVAVEVPSNAPLGTHDATVTLRGHNYAAVSHTFSITVVEPPPDFDAGPDPYQPADGGEG